MQRVLIKETIFLRCDNYSGVKFSLEQLIPNQMGSSRTPTCRMKNNLRLIPLTLSISKQAKNEESTRPKSKFLELKPFESSSSSKPSPYLELKTDHSASLVEIANQLSDPPFGSTTLRNCLATRRLLLFTTDLILSFRAQHTGTKGEDMTFWRFTEWVRRTSDLYFFVLSAAFQTQVQSSKKGISNSATQDSIMNAHNKTQFTHAKIKCALKDSSCDSPI
ncbi:hypothetical protein H5410_023486 [Solanum commersonii]|uniref:Uncharacterized protein n=1 Tax=Solanum commersonii TaxID=4109 RepID=A0A9J5ZIC5_SOLCO|nr:hypothetical protein H5410_023486 [Solanum commersonii]